MKWGCLGRKRASLQRLKLSVKNLVLSHRPIWLPPVTVLRSSVAHDWIYESAPGSNTLQYGIAFHSRFQVTRIVFQEGILFSSLPTIANPLSPPQPSFAGSYAVCRHSARSVSFLLHRRCPNLHLPQSSAQPPAYFDLALALDRFIHRPLHFQHITTVASYK
ncbi:hypothetical protein N7468_010138 [Penicillium chermesinum]|uniref:Uncharacterized protein n=1 Tax=Penicillium chermesinum TaxID=63820 RepID=A0A9W9TD21_9EURO|nr:uncharacterized protein N7468_010138 [Penicillium chermesinum]KAJ5217130.1 hypothetical protein N7468_010138 [Penicillium chermesinum]